MNSSKINRTVTFKKTENRWFPVEGDTIDMRGKGHASKKAVKEWAADRSDNTDENITVKFRGSNHAAD